MNFKTNFKKLISRQVIIKGKRFGVQTTVEVGKNKNMV